MVREDGIIRSRLPLPIAACLLAMLIGCQPEVGTLPDELPEEEIAITIGGTEITRGESTLNSLTARIENLERTNALLVHQLLEINSELKKLNGLLNQQSPLPSDIITGADLSPTTTPEKTRSLQNLELKLIKAVQTGDVDLLLQLYPSREAYQEIYSQRRLLTPDRLEQDDLDEAYKTFFGRYEEIIADLRIRQQREFMRLLGFMEHVQTADLIKLVAFGPSHRSSLVSSLRENAQRNVDSVYAGIFSELRSPSDPVLQNLVNGALIFIREQQVLVLEVELVEFNRDWYIIEFDRRGGFFTRYDSLIEGTEKNNWRFLSDNGQFFMDLFTQVKQGELVPLLPYIPADPDEDKIYEAEDYMLAPDILEPDINSTD